MKKLATCLTFALIAAACGGGSDDSTPGTDAATTTSTAPVTTTAPAPAATVQLTGNFCDDTNNEVLVQGVDFFAQDLEAAIGDWLAVIDAVEASAPNEIAADVSVIADAARTFAEILSDADYQMLNIDLEDPRLEAFNDGSLEEAGNNIAAYCGWDLETGGDAGGFDPGAGGGEFGGDDMPDSVPAALIPPSVTGVFDNGAAGVNIGSDTSFEDLLALYTDVLGEPDTEDDANATWSGDVDGSMVFVIVDDIGDMRVVTILTLPG